MKYSKKGVGEHIRKLKMLYNKQELIEGPGLAPIKTVQLYTKWRKVLPREYQDITFPEPDKETMEKYKTNIDYCR